MKKSFALGFTLAASIANAMAATQPVSAVLGLADQNLAPVGAGAVFNTNPMEKEPSVKLGRSTSGVSDFVGTLSVENFQGTQSNLSFTHDSADGFRNYLTTWYRPNFARQDSAVSVWLYHDAAGGDNFDLWNSGGTDYGIDAVRTAWHSGHGGMWTTNVFFAPMGANWAGRGWNAFSNSMNLGGNSWSYGDERLRYMFWDTCNSVMVNGGHNPYGTWGTRSKGIRMVFGYDTTSIDNPNYGRFFWEEWNKGKTLSQAFLDASWRISTGQRPTVVAFGANQAIATSILNNERFMTSASSGNGWGQWRWYNPRSAVRSPRAAALGQFDTLSPEASAVVPAGNSFTDVSRIAKQFGIDVRSADQVQQRGFNLKAVETKAGTLVVDSQGGFEMQVRAATPVLKSAASQSDNALVAEAGRMVNQLNLAKGVDLRPSLVRDTMEGGGSKSGKSASRAVEKTVVFDQTIDGVPFIDPNAGHVEISFDTRSGKVNRVRSNLLTVQPLAKAFVNARAAKRLSLDEARAKALQEFAAQGSKVGKSARSLKIKANTESVGYQVIGNQVVPVYRAEIADANAPTARPHLAVVPVI